MSSFEIPQVPTVATVLRALTVSRIHEIAREAGLSPRGRQKERLAADVAETGRVRFRALLAQLRREELRAACREHGLSDGGRARQDLMQRLLAAHGAHDTQPPPPLFSGTAPQRKVPRAGDTIVARHRQWLVDDVHLPVNEGDATWVKLTCLDDDHRGQPLELLWELELGAKVIDPEAAALGVAEKLDPPRHFGAYLHALRWQGVTASEKNHFQAPFRAGIEVLPHQLTPLQKALALPRANLFIADDVGLGKTIEAGLVLQELLLRQRVDFALIVAPASVTLQWQAEMDQRFGLRFEIYARDFVLARRRERGFGVNPWTTHPRFIISYPLLRRPEYRDPLLQHLASMRGTSSRAKKSLLILDEAHTAAPASASRYAVDSAITHVVRDIAPQFENRLFLSATPHNGHSNSFSALLEILDPQRFTRGVAVTGPDQLRPVMVRRLKRDLKRLTHSIRFPDRKVIRITLIKSPVGKALPPPGGGLGGGPEPSGWTIDLGDHQQTIATELPHAELDLARTLHEYIALFSHLPKTKRLPLINLQKRLLSSVEAFARTLKVHAQTKSKAIAALDSDEEADAERTLGLDDDDLDEREEQRVASASAELRAIMPEGAEALLESMRQQAEALRREPDAKLHALMAWMRAHQCPAVDCPEHDDTRWSDTRTIIFTEYSDTRRYLRALLEGAIAHTDGGDERILELHGGMSEEARDEVQQAFNDPGDPVRILICTDAAREGLNLQAQCQDLFHYDIPWNPSRMEQRNGRIDRALQPAPEVRCHYFVYADRAEDRVLQKVVEKTEIISRELGTLGEVVRERIAQALDPGIDENSDSAVETASNPAEARAVAEAELEAVRAELEKEERRALRTYSESQKRLDFKPEHLRDAIDVGLSLFGAAPLVPEGDAFRLPALPEHWQPTLDALRPPRGRDQSFSEHRQQPPRPVVFKAPRVLTQSRVHLHLEHPFVQRVLGRFLAQGFGHHDLSRVTAVAMPDTGDTHVLALGRLCLFGAGAGRLHDALICVAARADEELTLLDARDSAAHLAALDRRLPQLDPPRRGEGREYGAAPPRNPSPRQGDGRADGAAPPRNPSPRQGDGRARNPSPRRGEGREGGAAPTPPPLSRSHLDLFPPALQRELLQKAAHWMKALRPALRQEADAMAVEVEQKLAARAREESEQLESILEAQRAAIEKALGDPQLEMFDDSEAGQRQQRQIERDRAHLERRLAQIDRELATEPAELAALYDVKLRRFEPVGLVILYPEIRL